MTDRNEQNSGADNLVADDRIDDQERLDNQERLARRAALTRAIVDETGITEEMIARLVARFYQRVRADSLLGPIFEARISDWDAHLAKLCDFWSSVALMSGRYHGRPMPVHLRLPIEDAHFDRWLDLFAQTANELCPPAAAAHFIDRARRIANSMEFGLASLRGEIKSPRH